MLYAVFWVYRGAILKNAFEAKSKKEAIQKAAEDICNRFGLDVDKKFLKAIPLDKL